MEQKRLRYFSFLVVFTLLCVGEKVSPASKEACNRSIGECIEEYEWLMGSEIARRFLEGKKYISLGALKRDQPVCNGGANGQPYSSSGCLPPPSNPHNRGCSKYYRCRSDS